MAEILDAALTTDLTLDYDETVEFDLNFHDTVIDIPVVCDIDIDLTDWTFDTSWPLNEGFAEAAVVSVSDLA